MHDRTPGFIRLATLMQLECFRASLKKQHFAMLEAEYHLSIEQHASCFVVYCKEGRASQPACIVGYAPQYEFNTTNADLVVCSLGLHLQLYEQGADDAAELASYGPNARDRVETKGRVLLY